jgi:hypothetical protein
MTPLKPGSMLLGTTRPAELVEWISVADRAKGTFGTFTDPDGNYLQIIEWKKDA